MQVDPVRPTLKAPESTLLKLYHGKVLSNCAFKVDLRRYTEAMKARLVAAMNGTLEAAKVPMPPKRALLSELALKVGGLLRTTTRPRLNLLLLLRASWVYSEQALDRR